MGSVCAKPNKEEGGSCGTTQQTQTGQAATMTKVKLDATGEVMELKTKADFDKLLKDAGNKLVVVDFFATWCPPCKMIKPKYKELAQEMKDTIICAMVDVD